MGRNNLIPPAGPRGGRRAHEAYEQLFEKCMQTRGFFMPVRLKSLADERDKRCLQSSNTETVHETRKRIRGRLRSALVHRAVSKGLEQSLVFVAGDPNNPDFAIVGIRK